MAWTHFTAPLTAGQELTSAQWYELCEALAERQSVFSGATQVNLSTAASIAASGLAPRRVPVVGGSGMASWTGLLSGAANWYASESTTDLISSSAGDSLVTATEWEAEDLNDVTWETLRAAAESDGWNDRRFWNIIRATIQRLQFPRLSAHMAASSYRAGGDYDWSVALSEYDGYTPVTSTDYYGYTYTRLFFSGFYEVTGQKLTISFTLPSVTPLNGAEAWIYLDVSACAVADDLIGTLAASTVTNSLPTTANTQRLEWGPMDLRSAGGLAVQLASWDDPSAYEPVGAGTVVQRNFGAPGGGFFFHLGLKPVWAKP